MNLKPQISTTNTQNPIKYYTHKARSSLKTNEKLNLVSKRRSERWDGGADGDVGGRSGLEDWCIGFRYCEKKIKEGEINCCVCVEVVVEWSRRWLVVDQKRNPKPKSSLLKD